MKGKSTRHYKFQILKKVEITYGQLHIQFCPYVTHVLGKITKLIIVNEIFITYFDYSRLGPFNVHFKNLTFLFNFYKSHALRTDKYARFSNRTQSSSSIFPTPKIVKFMWISSSNMIMDNSLKSIGEVKHFISVTYMEIIQKCYVRTKILDHGLHQK